MLSRRPKDKHGSAVPCLSDIHTPTAHTGVHYISVSTSCDMYTLSMVIHSRQHVGHLHAMLPWSALQDVAGHILLSGVLLVHTLVSLHHRPVL